MPLPAVTSAVPHARLVCAAAAALNLRPTEIPSRGSRQPFDDGSPRHLSRVLRMRGKLAYSRVIARDPDAAATSAAAALRVARCGRAPLPVQPRGAAPSVLRPLRCSSLALPLLPPAVACLPRPRAPSSARLNVVVNGAREQSIAAELGRCSESSSRQPTASAARGSRPAAAAQSQTAAPPAPRPAARSLPCSRALC